MLIRISRRSYRAYSYAELLLITDLCSFGTPVGVTELNYSYPELILITGFSYAVLRLYRYLYLSQISRRSLQNLYLYYGVYTCSEVPVGITEITEHILILQNLFLYGSTCKYYKTKLILVLRILYLYYEVYPCVTDIILVFQI